MLAALILAWSPSAPPAHWAAPTASALPAAPPRAVETRRGYVARVSQAPGFILWPNGPRWPFGPQSPNANAGGIADDRAVETITAPRRATESFFIRVTFEVANIRSLL